MNTFGNQSIGGPWTRLSLGALEPPPPTLLLLWLLAKMGWLVFQCNSCTRGKKITYLKMKRNKIKKQQLYRTTKRFTKLRDPTTSAVYSTVNDKKYGI